LDSNIPKDIWIILQTILASRQSNNKCWIVSSLSQKQHVLLPYHFLLIRLSFVRITLRCKNHMKILIFSGTFSFQIYLRRYVVCPFNMSRYMDLTIYPHDTVKFQINTSSSAERFTLTSRPSKCNHLVHLYSVRFLLKATITRIRHLQLRHFYVAPYCIERDIAALEAYLLAKHLPKI
jgi:hypothetical protein